MVKAIIFDLDDTLLWDAKSVDAAFKASCKIAQKKHGVDPSKLEESVKEHAQSLYESYETYAFTKNIGIGTFEALWGDFQDEGESFQKLRKIAPTYRKDAWKKGLEDVGIHDEVLAEELAETFRVARKENVFLYEETLDVLDELKDDYKLLLLTNGSPDLQRTKLKLSPELVPYFEHIVISGDFGSGKPDPTIFKHALKLLDVDRDEALMVGDNLLTDILGAFRTGIDSVWINHDDQKPEKVTPTYEIKRLKEILSIVKQ
ncbi:MAG TPA: HAD family hydrolase [Bacillota bacterium]